MTAPNNTCCIDCGSDKLETAFIRYPKDCNTVVQTKVPVSPQECCYVIVHCRVCDSIFLHPYYYEEAFKIYENEQYYGYFYPNNIHPGGGPSLIHSSRSSYYSLSQNLKKARSFLKLAGLNSQKGPRIVDIGCGSGELLNGFIACGCNAYGLDISKNMVLKARRFCPNVYHTSFENSIFPDSYFDLVISRQVFEHIAYLDKVLGKIKRALKPNASLIIEIPNDIEGYRRIFYRKIWWIIPPIHIRYFTKKSIENLLNRYGFTVVSIRTTGSFGTDIGLVFRWLINKLTAGKTMESKINRFLLTLTHILLKPVDKLLSAASIHSEMIVLARA